MRKLLTIIFLLVSVACFSATYYISPSGSDAAAGTFAAPWRTLTKGWSVLVAGDTLYVRGGTYTTVSQMTLNNRSGTSSNQINIFSYQLEKPVFDYTASADHGSKSGISASNVNWIHWKGLRITGITQFAGTYNYGMFLGGSASNNVVENCEFDHIGGSGFFVAGPNSNNNLILNCDAHHNADPLTAIPYDGSNGFECTGQTTADNNIFRYCRSWWNSDDGYDGFGTTSSLIFDGCWAFWNGYLPGTFTAAGNGTGFKAGPAQTGVIGAVRRTYTNCFAFENRFNGFDQNFNGNGSFQQVLYNNTAFGNTGGRGFFYGGWTAINTLQNNLSFNNLVAADVNSQSVHNHNSWDASPPVTLSNADFISVSSVGADGPRQANGALPVLGFMHLAASSDLINKGINIGLPFCGSAPDMGCFEFCTTNVPPVVNAGGDQTITLPTSSVTLTAIASDADGTIASYSWVKTGGGTATITSPTAATTTVTGMVAAGSYTFTVTVTDNLGATASDVVVVLVNSPPNTPPTANAGADKSIQLPVTTTSFAGSGSDPGGSIVGYLWTQVSGPVTATIVSQTQANTTINNLSTAGNYVFNLRVTDNLGATGNDQVTVTVTPAINQRPVVSAGANQTITLPTSSVTLTATANDADGTIASYAWIKLSGPSGGTITSPSSASTTVTGYTNAGTYIYQVTVTDNLGLTNSATTQITVNAAPPVNVPPVVNAGADRQITLPTSTINQVGSATDADGTIASYAWTKISGPSVTIQSPTASTTNFNSLQQGTYVFQLQATDNLGATGTDQFTLVVNAAPNTPPIVNAGADQVITLPTSTTTLTATASDPGGSIAAILWTQIGGTASTIVSNSTLSTGITGLSTAGSRTYKILVTDNLGSTTSDTVIVLVNPAPNQPPVANAGADKNITLPITISNLVGSGSDPDGTIAAYLWTQISGIPATIVSATQASTNITNLSSVGVRVFQLRVTDNSGATATDQVSVTVNAANIPPTVSAGANQTITLPTSSVTLTATASDVDGSIASYAWTKISGPASGTITSPTSASTTVTAYSLAGTYVYQVVVTDNLGLTASSTTQIVVNSAPPPNTPPVVNAGADKNITLPTNSVQLVGSATDAGGSVVSYAWTKLSGPATGTIQTPTQSTTNFISLVQGTYVLRLSATDNLGAVGTDQVTVIVNAAPNTPPVVSAGADQTITLPTNTTTLVGTASDPGGSIASTLWTQIGGTASTITSAATLTTGITGLSTAGSRTYKLLATDNLGLTKSDTVIVLVVLPPNTPPVSNAGPNQTITLAIGQTLGSVTLTGSGTDADGTIVAYNWTKVSGPTSYNIVAASQAVTVVNNLTKGVYQFNLRVTDNSSATANDQVQITVDTTFVPPPPVWVPPTANAGPNVKGIIGLFSSTTTVTLTGSGFSQNGSIIGYQWTKISGPNYGNINSANSATTTISGLKWGIYQYQLRVFDNLGYSATDTVQVTITKNHLIFQGGRFIIIDY